MPAIQNTEYCHIAPNVNLFSDSELSISEEDSLEKERNNHRNHDTANHNGLDHSHGAMLHSPDKFGTDIENVSKSTPRKGHANTKSNGIASTSRHSNTARYANVNCAIA